MAGFAPVDCLRPQVTVRLAHPAEHARDRIEFVRARVTLEQHGDGYEFVAQTTGAQNSSRLLSMLAANALLRIEAGDAAAATGSHVQALLLDTPSVA